MRELHQTLIDGRDPLDTANIAARLDGMDTAVADYSTFKQATTQGLTYARVKWAGGAQATDANGVWRMALPVGLLARSPAVSIVARMNSGVYIPRITVTGSAAAGFVVTVTWVRLKDAPMAALPAVVVGAAATSVAVSLYDPPGVVTFDIAFMEPDAVGS
jgi:hypothetical protein